jgi:hypothetical protein
MQNITLDLATTRQAVRWAQDRIVAEHYLHTPLDSRVCSSYRLSQTNRRKPLYTPIDTLASERTPDIRVLEQVANEIIRARGKHQPIHSAHKACAVILEELDEFKVEVWKQTAQRSPQAMLQELVECAAMCIRDLQRRPPITALGCGRKYVAQRRVTPASATRFHPELHPAIGDRYDTAPQSYDRTAAGASPPRRRL